MFTALILPPSQNSQAVDQPRELVEIQGHDGVDVFRQPVFIRHPDPVRDGTDQNHVDGELPADTLKVS